MTTSMLESSVVTVTTLNISLVADTNSSVCNVARQDFIGDGWCDDEQPYNSKACGWDGGDCCRPDVHLWTCRDPTSSNFGKAAARGAIYPLPRNPRYNVGTREVSSESLVKSYNNFYEFAFDKASPREVTSSLGWFFDGPWNVEISGLVENPISIDVKDLIRSFGLEERVYRHRCVEGWSIVVPWAGFPLAKLLDLVRPTPEARYVVFSTFLNQSIAPIQAMMSSYPWPYTEAITIEEARNELAFLSVGQYQAPLPPQSGGPIRLTLPWKYGFKSAKSIRKIEFVGSPQFQSPGTFWSILAGAEYGFWANVNPRVPHPRWSQARERQLVYTSTSFDLADTLLYNGYEREVGSLSVYKGVPERELFM